MTERDKEKKIGSHIFIMGKNDLNNYKYTRKHSDLSQQELEQKLENHMWWLNF